MNGDIDKVAQNYILALKTANSLNTELGECYNPCSSSSGRRSSRSSSSSSSSSAVALAARRYAPPSVTESFLRLRPGPARESGMASVCVARGKGWDETEETEGVRWDAGAESFARLSAAESVADDLE